MNCEGGLKLISSWYETFLGIRVLLVMGDTYLYGYESYGTLNSQQMNWNSGRRFEDRSPDFATSRNSMIYSTGETFLQQPTWPRLTLIEDVNGAGH